MARYLLVLLQLFICEHMRYSFLILIFCLYSLQGVSQTDLPQTQTLNIGPDFNADVPTATPNSNSRLNIPSVLDKDLFKKKDPEIHMLPQRELLQAGHDLKLDAKVGRKEKKGSKSFFGDMSLGSLTTSSVYVGIVCRDHEYVDGDRIRIHANGAVVEPNILLTASFKGINLDLDKGFNRIEFEALNQGTSGLNTAQVDVYGENGEVIYSKIWNLSTGSKATLIIIQKD